jgi:hypothetical protein
MKNLLLILQHFKHCPLPSSLNRAQWYITYVSIDGAMHPRVYKACSKKDRTFTVKTLVPILQHFKHCPLQNSLNRAQWYIIYLFLDDAMHLRVHKACSKKDRTFAIKALLLNLQHFKHCPLQSSPLYLR